MNRCVTVSVDTWHLTQAALVKEVGRNLFVSVLLKTSGGGATMILRSYFYEGILSARLLGKHKIIHNFSFT